MVSGLPAQDEYTFDPSTFEKKSLQIGGYIEFRPVLFGLDRGSQFFKLRFFNIDEGKSISEYNFNALLDASYEMGIFKTKIRTNSVITKSFSGWSHNTSLYEAFVSMKPSPSFSIDIGKKRLKWGKGYAWNPVAFIDRPKNPNDPELALEGFVVVALNYIKSFQGKLKTISISPVLVPVFNGFNNDFGEQKKLNFGGKVYFLLYNTDIDVMFLSGGSMPARYGIDFSRNLGSNLEVHGELVFTPEYGKDRATSFLLGIRYLTKTNTTFFLEYYKNGKGFTTMEMEDYYSQIEQAYQIFIQSGDESFLNSMASTSDPTYRSFAPMRDYLYLRISQKEPWNILYFFPSITTIFNITDQSFSLAPELVYTPITNLELRAKISILVGKRGSDFGEKQNDFRLEFRGRYYF